MNALQILQRRHDQAEPAGLSAYEQWCETWLVEAMKSEMPKTFTSCYEECGDELFKLVRTVADTRFQPAALIYWRRQIDGLSEDEFRELFDDGGMYVDGLIELALFRHGEARDSWPAEVKKAMDDFEAEAKASAPDWGWIQDIYERRDEL